MGKAKHDGKIYDQQSVDRSDECCTATRPACLLWSPHQVASPIPKLVMVRWLRRRFITCCKCFRYGTKFCIRNAHNYCRGNWTDSARECCSIMRFFVFYGPLYAPAGWGFGGAFCTIADWNFNLYGISIKSNASFFYGKWRTLQFLRNLSLNSELLWIYFR